MLAVRMDTEQAIPTIPLEEHLRIIEEKDKKIHSLEKRLRLREDLDAVDAKIMSQNQKAALAVTVKAIETTKTDIKGRVLLPDTEALAKSAGQSVKTYQKNLSHLNRIGILKKDTLPVRNKDGEIVRTETYVRPTLLTYTPRAYVADEPRNHGGTRLACKKCGSERIEKRVTYHCLDCKTIHDEPPNVNPPVEPVEPEDQFGSTVNQDEHQLEPEIQATIVESYLVPEDQFGSAVDIDRKDNLTLLSNNILPGQLDPTVDDSDGESNIPPMSASLSTDPDTIIERWLNMRFGTFQVIKATEKLTQAEKYITLPESYDPDVRAFIRGDLQHIYGSKLINPETNRTRVLCFDLDYHDESKPDPQWLEQAQNWLIDFRRAGVTAIYWQRGKGGHFEIYFDQPVYPERARYWAYSICPDLEDIVECYPCQNVAGKFLSWPMWQRREYTVNPTPAHVILPEPHEGGLQVIDPTDKETLARVITVAVTPAALVEEYSARADELAGEQKCNQGQTNEHGGDIGYKPKLLSYVGSNRDLVPQVIADFNAQITWDDIATMAGGWSKEGYFKAVWRNERTASVKPDKDGRYAKDWGIPGNYPEKLDRYGAYCLICGIDQKADLAERCAELRRQGGAK